MKVRDISDLEDFLHNFDKSLRRCVRDQVNICTEEMRLKAVQKVQIPEEARSPEQFRIYRNSIHSKGVEVKEDEIIGTVCSDLLVGGESKWKDVHVGAFLEWGTGPLGMSTNTYPHGYDYTLHVWDFHTWLQKQQTGTYGIMARPHMLPALNDMKPVFERAMRKAMEQAWKQSTL